MNERLGRASGWVSRLGRRHAMTVVAIVLLVLWSADSAKLLM